MNRRQLTPGRESTTPWASTFDGREGHRGRRRSAWVALGPLALGMVLALGASPAAAVPPTPATGLGGSSPVPPVNGGIPVSDLDAAERLSALGERYIEEHALADAEAAFRGALAIAEAALGPTDPQLSGSMTALADVRSERQDFAGAEILYRRALAVVETAYGAEDPRIAGPLGNLAGLYLRWERWDDAAALYLRLAGVFERLLGANDFHVAMTLKRVADAHAARGRYAEADELYGKVLVILAPWLGSDNALVHEVLSQRAHARRQLELTRGKKG